MLPHIKVGREPSKMTVEYAGSPVANVRASNDNPDASRLIIELASVYVACDDCGHSRILRLSNLVKANELGAHTYRALCRHLSCSECPRKPPRSRNLTIRPTWVEGTIGSPETQSYELRKPALSGNLASRFRLRQGSTDVSGPGYSTAIQTA
jgi:hypothetical protein